MTQHSETPAKKGYTAADVDSLLSSEPKAAALSCQQLCDERSNDLDILQNLQDFPGNERAKIRAAIIRSLATITTELRSKKCAPCSE